MMLSSYPEMPAFLNSRSISPASTGQSISGTERRVFGPLTFMSSKREDSKPAALTALSAFSRSAAFTVTVRFMTSKE